MENLRIGRAWMRAFNARDVEALVSLYAADAIHTSPKIRVRHPETGGVLRGHAQLTALWKDAMERLPEMRYEPLSFTADEHRVFMEYLRHVPGEEPMPVAEVLDVIGGKIVASRVYHG